MSLGKSNVTGWKIPKRDAMEVFLAWKIIDLNGGFPSAMFDYEEPFTFGD
jgi:hypothetical protein